ncbi:MAG TPA: PilZ domain-containing protein [Terriglobales bacterium]|nr:PilZ domain-containing protein [Terriglobales bacterium]
MAHSAYPRERRHQRFNLRVPVKVKSSGLAPDFQATTRNVSVGGLLLEAPCPLPLDGSLQFSMSLAAARMFRPIELAGEGKVVRVEGQNSSGLYAIAIECARPITETLSGAGK